MEIRKLEPAHGRIQFVLEDSVRLELLGLITCPAGFEGEQHSHPFWELIHVVKGSGVFEVDGAEHTVITGGLYLLQPGQFHRFQNDSSESYQNLYIGFSFSFWPARRVRTNIDFEVGGFIKESVFAEVLSGIDKAGDSARAALSNNRSRLVTALAQFADYLTTTDPAAEQASRERMPMERAKAFLAQHIDRNIRIAEVAGLFYLSPHYVADMFKKHTGQSIKQYHHSLRMQRSYDLLVNSSLTVSEVAEQLGFASVHYFSRRFKAYFGAAPRSVMSLRGG